MYKLILGALCGLFIIVGCQQSQDDSNYQPEANPTTYPAAEGFNVEASDKKAIAIADSVMQAMGGYQGWKDTKIIKWNFFGRRTHLWNKETGKDRIEIPAKNMVIDFNINSKEGTVYKDEKQLSQPDSVQKYLQQGHEMWVNDAYWLIMPYKLKDSGVTLTYAGTDSTQTGEPAYKLKLTFDSVGITPDNMYYVYVDTTDYMVRQWAYFPTADMEEPQFILPWNEYKKYGKIMLSGNRGAYTISDIKVMNEWPESE